MFDLTQLTEQEKRPDYTMSAHKGKPVLVRLVTSPLKEMSDVIGSVAFHPQQQQLLSVAGSRHFEDIDEDSDSESDNSSEHEPLSMTRTLPSRPRPVDASVKIWDVSFLPHAQTEEMVTT